MTLHFCYQERDLCHPNPCLNGGTCSRTEFGGYRCECTSGYSGTNCTGDDNGNTLCNIKWNYNNTRGPQNWKYLCIIYYMFGKWVSLCIYFNLNYEQDIFYFASFFCLTLLWPVFENQVKADGRQNVPVFHSTALPNNLKAASPTHSVTALALRAKNKTTKCK